MSGMVARCRSCGFEQAGELADCPVCLGASGWWCPACLDWRSAKFCAACAGMLAVPGAVDLGAFPPGSRVPVRFIAKNRGKRPIACSVDSLHPALSLATHWLRLDPSEVGEITGTLILGQLLPGPHTYRVRFGLSAPTETELRVEVVAPVARLEFYPREVAFADVASGKAVRRDAIVKNTGNVPVVARLVPLAEWLGVLPVVANLDPGASTTVTVSAKFRKSDYGEQRGTVRADAGADRTWELPVRAQLAMPEVAADAVDFGDVFPEDIYERTLTIHNIGSVSVECKLEVDQPWLTVFGKNLKLPAGKSKGLRLRAVLPESLVGRQSATVAVTLDGKELLRVPVAVNGCVPNPVLAPATPVELGTVANDAPAEAEFPVANAGNATLQVAIATDQPWLEILTQRLRVIADDPQPAEFRVNAPALPLGEHRATISVRSNGGDADVPVSLTIVEPDPKLEVAGDADLGTIVGDMAAGHLTVRNVGVGLLKVRAEPEDSRVVVIPAEATVRPGSRVELSVAVATGDLDGGPHAFAIGFTGNGGVGRAEVRFRIPVEEIETEEVIDLGDHAAGRATTGRVRIKNTGPDPVTLAVLTDNPLVQLAGKRVEVKSGGVASVPFVVNLPADAPGPVAATIRLEGRKLRRAVVVRAVARRVELVVAPVFTVGRMKRGEEREVTLEVINRGEMTAEIRDTHIPGRLEVWIHAATIRPGETATITARVRMNARTAGEELLVPVSLADQASVLFCARVRRPLSALSVRFEHAVPITVATIGLMGSVGVGLSDGWLGGILYGTGAIMLSGLVYLLLLIWKGELK